MPPLDDDNDDDDDHDDGDEDDDGDDDDNDEEDNDCDVDGDPDADATAHDDDDDDKDDNDDDGMIPPNIGVLFYHGVHSTIISCVYIYTYIDPLYDQRGRPERGQGQCETVRAGLIRWHGQSLLIQGRGIKKSTSAASLQFISNMFLKQLFTLQAI